MTRKQAINKIFYIVASTGNTKDTVRIYIENRISMKVYNETIIKGLKRYANPLPADRAIKPVNLNKGVGLT